MAEFVKVIEEFWRMCDSSKCSECPLRKIKTGNGNHCLMLQAGTPYAIEAIIMAWAKDHPRKTMEDVLFERLPGIKQGDDGSYVICPRHINPEWAAGEECDEHNTDIKMVLSCSFRFRTPERCRKCWRRFVE